MAYMYWSSKDWRSNNVTETLKTLQGIENAHEMNQGLTKLNDFPKDAFFHINESYPRYVDLADCISSKDRFMVVSKRLKEFLESKITGVEYLPVSIFNHKNQIVSKDYSIVNPTPAIDCVNKEESEIEWDIWNQIEYVEYCTKLVFHDEKIPNSTLIFCPEYFYGVIFIDESLADEMEMKQFTGSIYKTLDKFRY